MQFIKKEEESNIKKLYYRTIRYLNKLYLSLTVLLLQEKLIFVQIKGNLKAVSYTHLTVLCILFSTYVNVLFTKKKYDTKF